MYLWTASLAMQLLVRKTSRPSKDTVSDVFGEGAVVHERTKTTVIDMKKTMEKLAPLRMQKNVRIPTEIIVATDGYCLGACAIFVNNIIRSGAAIVAGFGPTIPDEQLFAAGLSPSIAIDPADLFTDLTTTYGLRFSTPVFEIFDLSSNSQPHIPDAFKVYPIDVHSGYYDEYICEPTYYQRAPAGLLNKTYDVYQKFKEECNPNNQHLLLVGDCTSDKENAVLGGRPCDASTGKWKKNICKVASCKEGNVVDFNNDVCVDNPCDYHNIPHPPKPTPPVSASSLLRPIVSVLAAVFIALLAF